MKTSKMSEYSLRPRQLGGFGIIDKFGKCRITVPTRQAADDWIATQAQMKREGWLEVAGSRATHTVEMGEV